MSLSYLVKGFVFDFEPSLQVGRGHFHVISSVNHNTLVIRSINLGLKLTCDRLIETPCQWER